MCIRSSLSLNCWMFLIKMLNRKRLLRSAISKRNKELQHLSKELNVSENFLFTHLSIIDLYMLAKSITSHNKKSLQKSLYTQQKSYLHWRGIATYLYSQLTKLLLISLNMNYARKNLVYLKRVYTFRSNQIKFENLKCSLSLKRFIVRFLTTLNPRNQKSDKSASLESC